MKKLFDNTGNTLVMVMLAIGVLSTTTYVVIHQLSTSKKSVKSIQFKKEREFLEHKLIVYLSSEDVCTESMLGQSIPNSNILELRRNKKAFLKKNNTYAANSLKVKNISLGVEDENKYFLKLDYSKRNIGSSRTQQISKVFPLVVTFDEETKLISSCYLNYNNLTEQSVEQTFKEICSGSGLFENNNEQCKVLSYTNTYPDEASSMSCRVGEAISSYKISASGKFDFKCKKLINPKTCDVGLRYKGNGEFECFNLEDIILDDATGTIVNEGDECGLVKDINGKYKFSCNKQNILAGASNGKNPNSSLTISEIVPVSIGTCAPSKVIGYEGVIVPEGNVGDNINYPFGSLKCGDSGFTCLCGGSINGSVPPSGPILWNCKEKNRCEGFI